jgi:serine/threonine protein kinase
MSNEVKLFRCLAQASGPQVSDHVTELIDEFKHISGPNGIHLCLVFELMGPNVNTMLEDLPCFKKNRSVTKVQYPTWMAKRILRQACKALEFLHQNNVAHGDLQPGNILFTLKNLEHVRKESSSKFNQDANYKFGSTSPVQRKNGKIDKWAPKYLAVPQPLGEFADISPQFRIKLSDLGGGQSFLLLVPSSHAYDSLLPLLLLTTMY